MNIDTDNLLVMTPDYLGLKIPGQKTLFHIDFLSGKSLYRLKQASLKKELLARAIGIHPKEQPTVIDATAGLGRDSLILAALGYHIILIERSPILHALLEDAMQRASRHPQLGQAISRMQLICANSIEWLSNHPPADIIYLDPMFPERQKSASIKKELAILQNLLGKDVDSQELFDTAFACASRRVVVKRPRLSERISQKEPDFSLMGKSSRFDVYLIHPSRR